MNQSLYRPCRTRLYYKRFNSAQQNGAFELENDMELIIIYIFQLITICCVSREHTSYSDPGI